MIKRILVGLAGTTYTPVVIQLAVTLEQVRVAEVTGLTVLDPGRVRRDGIGPVSSCDEIRTELSDPINTQLRLMQAGSAASDAVSKDFYPMIVSAQQSYSALTAALLRCTHPSKDVSSLELKISKLHFNRMNTS